MKVLPTLIIIIATSLLYSCAAPGSLNIPKDDSGKYQYQGVVTVSGKSQAELYDAAKEWIALNFRSAQDVIQLDDRENGLLIAKGYFPIFMMLHERHIYHTIRLDTKDGRYRYTVNDFEFHTPGQPRLSLERANLSQKNGDSIDAEVKTLLESIKAAMRKGEEAW